MLAIGVFSGIFLGATELDAAKLIEAIMAGDLGSAEVRILLFVRLPRVIGTVVCGGALATSGAVIQGVLANRLASPSIIGVNAGAGLAVTLCTAAGLVGFSVSVLAFAGAFLCVMLISAFARRQSASRGTVILAGVAVSSLCGAISDTVVTFIPEVSVMSNDFRIGDFSAVTYKLLLPATVIILVSLAILLTLLPELDLFTLGEARAAGLGLNTRLMRVMLLLLAAALAGAAVSVCGLLSFVGLLVPHAVRRIGGNEAKRLIPLCALFGGGFVALCDTAARVIFAPYEIPVGIIMAFIGAPFFIFILLKGKGREDNA